ncbi:MAG: hypothetical protein COX57_12960 [Alphaproteobacteria bacterium CG_4_10_14_0_2_um_filter_63_37]|nr:MAG: hypothetical protein AUJ55_04775 [Proteobacteria bacterium CG1_02_64_396]PJA23617.1 MAG: hypothetical protein COX57_12960 [Alphaproteobacteria bacterium CG_4_10_14_0_2_um_filter_63_37]
MSQTLILYAHPDFPPSVLNRQMAAAITGLPGVTLHRLAAAYPDFAIDVAREQALLVAHDTVVLQTPFYWYSTPAIFKHWQDLVLGFGFAYGPGGDKLMGKKFAVALTSGGPAETYAEQGRNRYTIEELLRPLQAMASLCQMAWQPHWHVGGIANIPGLPLAPEKEQALASAVADYQGWIQRLSQNA